MQHNALKLASTQSIFHGINIFLLKTLFLMLLANPNEFYLGQCTSVWDIV